MSPAAFFIELRRRSTKPCLSRDPLGEARRFLVEYGDTAEGQALRRAIDALGSGNGEFAESDVWLFSAETLGLVDALCEARTNGGLYYTTDDFRASLDK